MLFRDLYMMNKDWTKKTKIDVKYNDIEAVDRGLDNVCIGDIPGCYFDMRVVRFGSGFVALESNWG